MRTRQRTDSAGGVAGEIDKGRTAKAFDINSPRHLRAIHELITQPRSREHLDRAVGCSNSPELVAQLRRRGLEIPCKRISDTDRDGRPIQRGVYSLSENDHVTVSWWLRTKAE